METYSVEAILSAIDKNFVSTMKSADGSMGTLDKNTQNTNTSILDIAKGVGVFKVVDSAIGVVKSSLDGAINRFDTLNAYPKVMAQMGYSTDDVSKSVTILKKGVDGLPTSLQDLTKSAQSFAILEKSATKGAETATALNDAFLASGASAADASRGVEQYSQMLSSGSVDLQSWKTLQETMPYALTQVAKSFGITGKSAERDLYKKLKSGDITMEQLNKRFVELDTSANGFAQTARTASGGIGTSFTNMRNAVVNGMANTVETINNALKDAGLKNGISTLFDEGKQAIIKGFAVFNQIVATAIPPIVATFKTLFDFIDQNKGWLKPLLVSVTGGIIAFKTISATIKGVSTAINTLKTVGDVTRALTGIAKGSQAAGYGLQIMAKESKIAAAAQKVLNVAMKANWVVIIISAIIALVTGFIYLWNTSEEFRNFWIGLWEGIKKAVDTAVKGIQSAWNATVKWFTDTWNNIKNGAKGLWDGTIQGAKDAVDSVKNAWSGVKEWFSNLWKGTTSGLSSAWDIVTTTLSPFVETIKTIFQPMLDFFSGLWGQVQTIFSSAWEIIKTVVMGPVLLLIDLITGNFNQFKEDLSTLWQTLCTNIQTLVSTFVQIVVGYFTAWGQTVSNIWTTVVNTVQSLWGAFTTWAINMAISIVDGIVNGWNSFKQGTIDLWNATIQWVKDTWASFKQWVIDSANAIVDGVKQGWENLKQGTIDLWNGMVEGLKGIWDGLKQSVSDLIDKVKTTFNNLKNINLLDIGKAIIDGFVKGLKQKWEDGMKFISGIGDWIREHKGPIRVDRKLLTPAGNAIMGGLNTGLTAGFRDVQSNVSGMGDMIANAINSDYSVDIGANVAAANRSISSQVSHDVNLNQGKQPALFNVRLGNQSFKAFVDDISNAQGQAINLNMEF
ncbi:Phage tail length tape-measure protein [Lactococcus lactis subsp. lactis]|uniref:Minor tail protein gp26-like protein n=2 Tax=Lactococcus lactis TaxID=1358 RepID=A0A2A5SA84_LACLH|nr:tape measure protein [Lactococcus lactis]KAA8701464.1 tape measure protein [Lactococcus lactis subsp. hordniae]KSU05864.1 Phage tail length tape-measure protein [Lactococcus lactis subsp. lactis]MCT3135736.1 phage tail protein [Lactococcus lactis]PCS10409.1 minor tail protein gp26-like protein [Lactococcus lactis subsp. hordniae]